MLKKILIGILGLVIAVILAMLIVTYGFGIDIPFFPLSP